MTDWTIEQADVIKWAEAYRGEPFHAVLCDPSYGLGDDVDTEALLTAWLNGDDYDMGPGFMGRDWDQLPSPRFWQALYDVSLPGAPLFAFGGTRTADLLSVAIRLGGWEKFDEIDSIIWNYGSGFPKSTDISKAIDAAAGAERKTNGRYKPPDGKAWNLKQASDMGIEAAPGTFTASGRRILETTAPSTPQATAFDGYGTALKPAHEPVLCFRKPLGKVSSDQIHRVTGWDWWHSEKEFKNTPANRLKMLKRYGMRLPPAYVEIDITRVSRKALHRGVESDALYVIRARRQWRRAPTQIEILLRCDVKNYRRWYSQTYAANALVYGTGGLWINGGRIAGSWKWGTQTDIRGGGYGSKRPSDGDIYAQDVESHPSGRWPSNLLLTHAPGCRRRGTRRVRGSNPIGPNPGRAIFGGINGSEGQPGEGFDYADPDGLETVDDWECEPGCPVAALAAQSGELRSGGHPDHPNRLKNSSEYRMTCYGEYGRHLSRSFSDAGTAARFFQQCDWSYEVAERLADADPFHYCAKASGRERNAGLDAMPERTRNRVNPGGLEHEPRWAPTKVRNPHPTLKPISLTKYLATLLLPPAAYAPRRVLVPFAGTGSEMLGALLAGFEEIIGVEMEADYCDIARARLAWWADRARWGCSDVETLLATADGEPDEGPEQLELFGG